MCLKANLHLLVVLARTGNCHYLQHGECDSSLLCIFLYPCLLANGLLLPCLCWHICSFLGALSLPTVNQWNSLKPEAGFVTHVHAWYEQNIKKTLPYNFTSGQKCLRVLLKSGETTWPKVYERLNTTSVCNCLTSHPKTMSVNMLS